MTQVFTINTGSSSLKVALFEEEEKSEARRLSGEVSRIGEGTGRLRLADTHGALLMDRVGSFADHGAALDAMLACVRGHRPNLALDAVGHRVVQGGVDHREPERIMPDLIAVLQALVPIAPDHLPQAISAIQAAGRAFPNLPQVACFDTAFHRHMPRVAQMYPLPRQFGDEGLIRFGFHGLSYESILLQLRAVAPTEAKGRVIIAHLGNGASMAAVRGGVGIDTTMGFTPAGGLMMGTRPGDLDPGVLLYLMTNPGTPSRTASALDKMINRGSGLLGVSGLSADMRDLLEHEPTNPHAGEAIALFCYLARKHLCALTAPLEGLDSLVFTGGIGEHAASIRSRICEGLAYLGVRIDPHRNFAHARVISTEGASVTVRVLHTDEDMIIARHTWELLTKKPDPQTLPVR